MNCFYSVFVVYTSSSIGLHYSVCPSEYKNAHEEYAIIHDIRIGVCGSMHMKAAYWFISVITETLSELASSSVAVQTKDKYASMRGLCIDK